MAIAASPTSRHIATLGEGGRLHLYNYKNKRLLAKKQFPGGGRDLIWLHPSVRKLNELYTYFAAPNLDAASI